MLGQDQLKVFTIVLGIALLVLLPIMFRKSAPVDTGAVPAPPAVQLPSENPSSAEPFRSEVEKHAGPEITPSQPLPQSLRPATPPGPGNAPSVSSDTESSTVTSSEVSRTASLDTAAAAKSPGRFVVFSRGNQLSNGFSFMETDEKFGLNSPGDIAWEFNAQPTALRGSATLKWFLDGKPRGYPIPLTEEMLQQKQIYPDMPEPGVWEIKLARPGEKDLLLFTFTILKDSKGARP